jgi:hypothetical protein
MFNETRDVSLCITVIFGCWQSHVLCSMHILNASSVVAVAALVLAYVFGKRSTTQAGNIDRYYATALEWLFVKSWHATAQHLTLLQQVWQ